MTVIIKSSDEDTIAITTRLMAELRLQEGDEVKAIIEGQTLRLARLDQFLALRGSLSDDEGFDRAMEFMDQAWEAWTKPTSA